MDTLQKIGNWIFQMASNGVNKKININTFRGCIRDLNKENKAAEFSPQWIPIDIVESTQKSEDILEWIKQN